MEVNEEELNQELFKSGDFIFQEGDPGYHFFIIDSGKVEIFRYDQFGKKLSLATLTDGDAFGEFALLDKSPRSASARALEDSKIVRVSEAGYWKLLDQLPFWATAMLKAMTERLKHMNEMLAEKEQFIQKPPPIPK